MLPIEVATIALVLLGKQRLQGRMNGAEYGSQKIAARQYCIAFIDEVAVARQECVPVFTIEARNFVPRQGGLQVMSDVQIIVEVQQAKQRIGFYGCGSFLRI